MSRPLRYTQKVFGSSITQQQIAEFGSLAASSPALYTGATITPAIVQALSNYLGGWYDAIEGVNSPAIEDMNALEYLWSYQLAYLLTLGIPEWDSGTTYYKGCLVSATLFTFTVTSANATVGAVYSNNSTTFVVQGTISSGTTLVCQGYGSPGASGTLTKVSGTGDATITFSAATCNGGVRRQSITDSQSGNAISDNTNWADITGLVVTTSSALSIAVGTKLVKVSGNTTVTWPDATLCAGASIKLVKTDSNSTTVTHNTTSSQTISGVASGSLTQSEQYSFYELTSDGSNWLITAAG